MTFVRNMVLGLIFVLAITAPATAQPEPVPVTTTATEEGGDWFARMQEALTELNYAASVVHVRGERMELFRWLHGQTETGAELELLSGLNGPESHVLRQGHQVAYYSPVSTPYSLYARHIIGPFPKGLYEPYDRLQESYNVVAMGTGRVLDRAAQHVRLLARDRSRYGYSIWLDQETGMLLRVATLNDDGEILEQTQLTSLDIRTDLPEELQELAQVTPPPLVIDYRSTAAPAADWQLDWVPPGFRQERTNRHELALSEVAADYQMYSDGMTSFSVYVVAGDEPLAALQYSGIESLYTHDYGDYQVTVVGRLPLATIQQIATAVRPADDS